jgi:hypothetical protein
MLMVNTMHTTTATTPLTSVTIKKTIIVITIINTFFHYEFCHQPLGANHGKQRVSTAVLHDGGGDGGGGCDHDACHDARLAFSSQSPSPAFEAPSRGACAQQGTHPEPHLPFS